MTAEAPDDQAPRRQRARGRPEGWRVATLAGVPVLLARSWLLVAALLTYLFGPQVARVDPGVGLLGAYAVALLYAVLLLVSVLVHELAHAVSARAFAMSPTRIVLTLWGGHTSFDRDAPTPWASFVVSAAGPVSNIALAAALYWGLGTITLPPVAQLLLLAVVLSNAFVGITNALPGLPLDGGRMLEAVLWRVRGDRDAATEAAASAGRVVALAVPVLAALWLLRDGSLAGDLLTLAWSALIGGLLWTSAGSELGGARVRRRAPGASVAVLVRGADVVREDAALSTVLDHGSAAPARPVVLVDERGAPTGVLDPAALASVPSGRRATVPVSAVSLVLSRGATVPVATSGPDLLERLSSMPPEPWVVLDGREVVGVLLGRDVVAAMTGRRPRAARRPTYTARP